MDAGAVEDNEKYDKIRKEQNKFRLYLGLAIVLMTVIVASVQVITKHNKDIPFQSRQHAKETIFQHHSGPLPHKKQHHNEHGGQDDASQPDVIGEASLGVDIDKLEKNFHKLDAKVRKIKKTGVIMETDPKSLEMTGKLQEVARELMKARYGDFNGRPYRIKLDLEFQPSIPDFAEKGVDATLLIELGPIDLIPMSVFNYMEIARGYKGGGFHRNAGHVLQVQVKSEVTQSMPFQEYHPDFPHKKGTVGYAGRPSGPAWYVSIQDNSRNHGPGSQQKDNPHEADSCIGKIIDGGMDPGGVVQRIHTMPGNGFLPKRTDWVLIKKMHILIPNDTGPELDGYSVWKGEDDHESGAAVA